MLKKKLFPDGKIKSCAFAVVAFRPYFAMMALNNFITNRKANAQSLEVYSPLFFPVIPKKYFIEIFFKNTDTSIKMATCGKKEWNSAM